MSSVFISNVDDYLAPSQACVNPMFTTEPEKKLDAPKQKEAAAVVVPRRRGRRRRIPPTPSSIIPPTSVPSSPAQVTMADCLACSGCVTTAETVLVEQHSLQTLQQALNDDVKVAMTMSPASWADLARKLKQSSLSIRLKQKVTSFLHSECNASIILDGRVPLEWSLHEAAREFCHVYTRRNDQETSTPVPTMAVSSTQIQHFDGTMEECISRNESRLPLLSSSCPALVCLVEKSTAAAVPHLATTQSPMAMAGTYLKSKFDSHVYHVAVMPCHDKKLEASRKDLYSDDSPLVDLVLTTSELWTLLCENAKSENAQNVFHYLETFEMAPVSTRIQDASVLSNNNSRGLLVCTRDHDEHGEPMDLDTETDNSLSNPFFPNGSGGYANFIFKFACRHLFGYEAVGDLPWTPVTTSTTLGNGSRRVVSARVASVQAKRRDYHQVTLYRHVDGTYSCINQSPDDVPVLRFATAYGLQNIQRVLQSAPFSNSNTSASSPLVFDYVEAMACPSGCPNGGGQIREQTQRETPTETRERVTQTIQVLKQECECESDGNDDDDMNYPLDLCPTGPFGQEAQRVLHTRFHVVPPLQHTMGAAAGVNVKDTEW